VKARAALLAAALAVAGWLVFRARPDVPAPNTMCLYALDVGQGDAMLLRVPGNAFWLIDGGGSADGRVDVGRTRLLPALRREGVERLERVVVTHAHADHFEGLFAVFEEVPVDAVWIGSTAGNERYRALIREAESRGATVSTAADGPRFGDGATMPVRWLHPSPAWLGHGRAANDESVVFRASWGAISFLLTGDIEAEAEGEIVQAGADLQADVLKIAHHGSRTSTGEAFLGAVRPAVALGGIGRDNEFGFPHHRVVLRLVQRGTPLYWTGRSGDLRVCTDGAGIEIARRSPRWETLRTFTPAQLAARRAQGELAHEAFQAERAERRPRGKAPRKAPTRRKERREQAAEPTPAPVLLDAKTHARHRKAAKKPRAPWEGGGR
jgi:competence protein ComEC